jgi:hypothetical protein
MRLAACPCYTLRDRAIRRTAATHRRFDESRVYSSNAANAVNPVLVHFRQVAEVEGALTRRLNPFSDDNLQSRANMR